MKKHAFISFLALCTLFSASANGAVLSKLLGKPVSSLASAFVGEDKLKGKYATAGLLLGTSVLTGHYIGSNLFDVKKGGLLKEALSSKLDGLFDPLLAVEPFKFDPFGKKEAKSGLFSKKNFGTAITSGGDVISSKLGQKLEGLSTGLGVVEQAPSQAMNAVDGIIRTKENIVRGAIDSAESFIETNPQMAAMKNLLFRALIYHVYMDAGLNARLSMLEQASKHVISYKKFFEPLGIGVVDLASPVLDRIRGVTGNVATVLALPARVFNLQADATEGGAASEPEYTLFSDRLAQLQDALQLTRDSTTSGQATFYDTLTNWLDSFRNSEGISRVDQAQRWRLDASDYLDTQTQNLERDLNSILNERSDALIGLLDGSAVPDVDVSRVRSYLTDLGRVMSGSTSSALTNFQGLTDTVFDSIQDLAASGVSNPLDYQRAGELIGTGAANTAGSIWETFQSAFDRQQQIAELFNLDLPISTSTFDGAFDTLLNTFQDFSALFPVSV